jgi:hypothetical protein
LKILRGFGAGYAAGKAIEHLHETLGKAGFVEGYDPDKLDLFEPKKDKPVK